MYRILLSLYTYFTGSISRYKYSHIILISKSYLSHIYYCCASPSIFDECYGIDCGLHHAGKSPIVLSMWGRCHWLTIIKNTLGAQHQSYQASNKHVTVCFL
jgi:hypothetical protein